MISFNLFSLEEPIDINGFTYFVLEDHDCFLQMVKELLNYVGIGNLRIFDRSYETVCERELMLITDFLTFNLNNSTVLKSIYKDLEDQFNDNLESKSKLEQLTYQITDIISEEIIEHELNLSFGEITLQELFKDLDIKVDYVGTTFPDKMMDIIQVFKYLKKKRLLIFVNTHAYFTPEEMIRIKEYIELQQIDVLFVEKYKMPGIENHILDEDYYFYREVVV